MTLTNTPNCAIRRVVIAPATHQAGDVIQGYLALWGTRQMTDCYGTWFDRNKPPDMALEFVPIPLWYEHGFDPQVGKTTIGEITRTWADETGIRFEAVLYRNTPHYARIRAEIDRGELGVSSSSADHIAEFDEQKRFVKWLPAEISLTDAPCEYRMPAVQFTRSEQGYQVRFQSNVGTKDGVAPCQCKVGRSANDAKPTCGCLSQNTNLQRRDTTMTLQELIAQGVTDPMQLFSALVQELGGVEAAMQALQQMNTQPAPEAGEMSSVPPMPRSAVTREQLEAVASALRGTPAPVKKPVQPAPTPAPAPANGNGNNNGEIAALRTQLTALTDQLKAMAADRTPAPNQNLPSAPPATRQTNRPGGGNGVSNIVHDLRYAHLDYKSMLFGHMAMRGAKITPQGDYMRAMAYRTAKALEKGDAIIDNPHVRSNFPFIRADEVMQSDVAAIGDEWVGDAYGTNLWEKARIATIWEEMASRGMMEIEIPQGAESFYVPLESNDPTFYSLVQSADLDSTGEPEKIVQVTPAGTGRVQVNAGFVGAAVSWNGVLEEDSLIPMLSQLSNQMELAAQEKIEYLILNGDTTLTASTNINLIDGTPTTTARQRSLYLATNGILKLPLVTTTAQSRDGGVLDEDDFLNTIALLPNELQDESKLMFVLDSRTRLAALKIPSIKTKDVNSNATIESGVLKSIWGVDVFRSGQMALANTAGKISATPGNNTKGRILLVYPGYWALGWKRRITSEVERSALADTNTLVMYLRMGVQYRSNTAAAITYNLTV